MSKGILNQLIRADINQWKREPIEKLTGQELDCLFMILGTPRYTQLKRQQRVNRMLEIVQVRIALRPYKLEDATNERTLIQRLSNRYNGKLLKDWCKKTGTYPASTKYGMAAGLLAWSRECRRKGQKFIAEVNKIRRERTHIQKSLPLWNPPNDDENVRRAFRSG